jgi:hypothetical protein
MNLHIAEDLHAYNPELKFIYLVRDPLDRIVSHYMHVHERGYIDRSLEDAVRTMPILLNVSRHHMQVLPFIERFGRDRVLLLDFHDLVHDREHILDRVSHFTGLVREGFPLAPAHSNPSVGGGKVHHRYDDPSHWAHTLRRRLPGRSGEWLWRRWTRRRARGFETRPELDPAWKKVLMRLLEADVLALERTMQRDLSAWWEHAGLQRAEHRTGDDGSS